MRRARAHGILIPGLALAELRRRPTHREFDYALLCALLMRESFGGLNVFGHDPTIYAGAGKVTREKYLAYARLRDRRRVAQGVGPLQLTYPGFQDAADRLGGCWVPRYNLRVGIGEIDRLMRAHGLEGGLRRWNGSGSAAERYAREVVQARRAWRGMLSHDGRAGLRTLERLPAVSEL